MNLLDPFEVFGDVLHSVWVRLVLFAATVFFGGTIGLTVSSPIPTVFLWFGCSLLVVVPLVSLTALVILIRTESAFVACSALAVNCLAWILPAVLLGHI